MLVVRSESAVHAVHAAGFASTVGCVVLTRVAYWLGVTFESVSIFLVARPCSIFVPVALDVVACRARPVVVGRASAFALLVGAGLLAFLISALKL